MSEILREVFISPFSLEEWVWLQNKPKVNISVIWRAVLNSFDLIAFGLACKVDNGVKVRIGVDSWCGCPSYTYRILQDGGCTILSHLNNPETTFIWKQGWKSMNELALEATFHEV